MIAEAQAVLLTGGLAGVMAAAAEGARQAGGVAVSVLPGSSADDSVASADVTVATGAGEARNVILVRSADAVVAIGGGFGTLSEIALARKLGLPVFGYRTWSATTPDGGEPLLRNCESIDDAVSQAIAAAREAASAGRD